MRSGIGPLDPKVKRRPPQFRTSPIKAYGSSSLRIRPQGCPSPSVRHTDPGSGPGCVASDGPVVPTSSFATHRLLWVSYPAFKPYYEDAKTASARLSAFAFRSAPITPIAFSFLPDAGEKRAHVPGSCSSRCDPLRHLSRRQEALPASLETPFPLFRFALLSDPGRTSTPDHCGVSVLSPLLSTRRLPH